MNGGAKTGHLVSANRIERTILHIRGQKVMLDADLADLYGVATKALNQAVKRNSDRFPPDFMSRVNEKEKTDVVTSCDHLSSSMTQYRWVTANIGETGSEDLFAFVVAFDIFGKSRGLTDQRLRHGPEANPKGSK